MPEYEIPFFSKSEDYYEYILDDIFTLTKYRDELDILQVTTPSKNQVFKAQLLHESKKVTKFINDYYKQHNEFNG